MKKLVYTLAIVSALALPFSETASVFADTTANTSTNMVEETLPNADDNFIDLGAIDGEDVNVTITTKTSEDAKTLQSAINPQNTSDITIMSKNTIVGSGNKSLAGTYKLGTKLLKRNSSNVEPGVTITVSKGWPTTATGKISFKVGPSTVEASLSVAYTASQSYSAKIPKTNSKGKAIKYGAFYLKGDVTVKLNSVGQTTSHSIKDLRIGIHYKLK